MNELVIKSMLDTDNYKLSMGQAILELFPNTNVVYKFKNRGKQRFNNEFMEELKNQINLMQSLALTEDEYKWLKETIPYLKPCYLEFLKNYRFKPSEVNAYLDEDQLNIEISGPGFSTIYWEVPLLAMISEIYFKTVDKNWSMNKQDVLAAKKIGRLANNGVKFSEFGTRRRRSFETQELVVNTFVQMSKTTPKIVSYVGTSNVYLSYKTNFKPMGTMAHEWIMGCSVLNGLRKANFYGLQNWTEVYHGNLGIALTDTYGLNAFFRDFSMRLAKLYDGVRHDSGDPYQFVDKVVAHYNNLKVNPFSKSIIFSDGLNIETAIKLNEYCNGKINCAFGIGTHFTNDFENSPALNMVIKLWSVNDIPVVKLGENNGTASGKEMGDKDAIRVAKWTFSGTPLDEIK